MAKLFLLRAYRVVLKCAAYLKTLPECSTRVLVHKVPVGVRGSRAACSKIFFYCFISYFCNFLFNTCKSQTLIFPSYAPDTILFESNLNYRSIQSFIWQWSRTQNWSLLEIKMYDSQFYFLNCSFGKNIEVLFSAWTFIIFYSKFCRKLAYSPFSKFSNNKDDIFPIVNPMKISKLCVP